jgi:hypothetical protein
MGEEFYISLDCDGRTIREVYEHVQAILRNPCGEVMLTERIVIGRPDRIKPRKNIKNFKF